MTPMDFNSNVLTSPLMTSATKTVIVFEVMTTVLGSRNLQTSLSKQNCSKAGGLEGLEH